MIDFTSTRLNSAASNTPKYLCEAELDRASIVLPGRYKVSYSACYHANLPSLDNS